MSKSDPYDRLGVDFFDRDGLVVARELLGRYLRHGDVVLQITEVEAYRGPTDSASHTTAGHTSRTAPLFGPPGRAYIYLCYGIHQMLNLVAHAPHGVLVRACAPVEGHSVIRERRGGRDGPSLLNGPGKVGQALALDSSFNHHPVTEAHGLEVLGGHPVAHALVGPRVGIDYANDADRNAPWRFAVPDSAWVSHARTLRPQR